MENCIYCPKCDRSIPKDEVAERSRKLIEMFDNRSLEKGKCPVCGTIMIDIDEVATSKESGEE